MKIKAILLLLMIGYDLSLHIVELINKVVLHPLYPSFPLFGFISYNFFWTVYWCLAFIIMLTLLRSGATIKKRKAKFQAREQAFEDVLDVIDDCEIVNVLDEDEKQKEIMEQCIRIKELKKKLKEAR